MVGATSYRPNKSIQIGHKLDETVCTRCWCHNIHDTLPIHKQDAVSNKQKTRTYLELQPTHQNNSRAITELNTYM